MSTETITARPWAGPQDTEAIRALLRLRYWQQGPPSYPSASDFDYWLATTGNRAVPQGIQLWFDGDQLVGYVWPADNELDCIVHPRTHAALPAMVAWADARLCANPSTSETLKAWCFAGDAPMEALLTAAGYQRSDEFLRCSVFDMHAPLPDAPVLPAGYTVRSLRGAEEAEARAAAHMAAFPDWPMNAAKHVRAMHTQTYRLDLDLVATAPDGTPDGTPDCTPDGTPYGIIVATAIVWYDAALRMGLFEPIGCDPAHQRRHLATACIVEGLRRLKVAGASVAVVCGWRDDSVGSRLYEKLGFREGERRYVWEKQLQQTDDVITKE